MKKTIKDLFKLITAIATVAGILYVARDQIKAIIAKMAKEYVLLVDETKVTDKLNNKVPVVLDIIPEAVNYVTSQVEAMGATVKKRDEHLLEVYYDTLPELEEIDKNLKMITGVIETSLFYQVATKALVAGEEGIRVIK